MFVGEFQTHVRRNQSLRDAGANEDNDENEVTEDLTVLSDFLKQLLQSGEGGLL